jgi:hypothetical protein
MIASIPLWLPALLPCLIWLPAISSFPRTPCPATSDFRLLLPYPSDSNGLEHSKPVQSCSQFSKCVSRLKGGS